MAFDFRLNVVFNISNDPPPGRMEKKMNTTPAIAAMQRRVIRILATEGLPSGTAHFWSGYAQALRDLSNGTADLMAAKDARSGDQPEGNGPGARPGLAENQNGAPHGSEDDGVRSETREFAENAVTNLQLCAVQQLEGEVLAVLPVSHREHAPSAVDGDDRASAHAASVATASVSR